MTQLKQDIYWTGFIDWDLRNFHGYSTPNGSTYNAYLINDEKPTLIDSVKEYGFEEMLFRIRQVMDPARIAYIISNHTEMDHSGAIDKLLAYCPQAQVVCSPKGEEGLRRHFHKNWNFKVVRSGDTLTIGRRTLQFVLMPMVHWPDSMATYSSHDAILFPNDAFGQHYASPERFVDEVGVDVALRQAAKYYANIVLPYGNQVLPVLAALREFPVDMIAPSHGLLWRRAEDIARILTCYGAWARHETASRAVIVYDTMWHSTQRMARYLYEQFSAAGIPVSLFNLQTAELSDIIAEILVSRMVLVGSSILNNNILPTVGAFMTYARGLKPRQRSGMTFGSYGWSPKGFTALEEALADAGIELAVPGVYARYVPDDGDRARLAAAGAQLIQAAGCCSKEP